MQAGKKKSLLLCFAQSFLSECAQLLCMLFYYIFFHSNLDYLSELMLNINKQQAKKTIIFIHGLASNHFGFINILFYLKKAQNKMSNPEFVNIIFFNINENTLHDDSETLWELIQELGQKDHIEQIYLIGHSRGAFIIEGMNNNVCKSRSNNTAYQKIAQSFLICPPPHTIEILNQVQNTTPILRDIIIFFTRTAKHYPDFQDYEIKKSKQVKADIQNHEANIILMSSTKDSLFGSQPEDNHHKSLLGHAGILSCPKMMEIIVSNILKTGL